jgi:hypothetical protein
MRGKGKMSEQAQDRFSVDDWSQWPGRETASDHLLVVATMLGSMVGGVGGVVCAATYFRSEYVTVGGVLGVIAGGGLFALLQAFVLAPAWVAWVGSWTWGQPKRERINR